MNLNQYIDHTLLKNTAQFSEFRTLCEEADQYSFYSVCIPPSQVTHCSEILKNSSVKICSVAGFPLGYSSLNSKVNEIKNLYMLGADEVDSVLNITSVKSEKWNLVEEELKECSQISNDNTFKLIIESGILTENEILKICELTTKHPVSFLKTSTGFASHGASIKHVELMNSNTPAAVKVKASGGIKTQSDALAYIKAGASRLGCSSSIKIIKG